MSAKSKSMDIITKHKISKVPLIMKMEENKYGVKSLTREEFYQVKYYNKDSPKNECDCPSFRYRSGVTENGYCKHIWSIELVIQAKVTLLTLDECIELGETN